MTTVTIPKALSKKGDLVIIPRKEYEELLSLKKAVPMFKPTKAELKAVVRGEREFTSGKFKPWDEFKNELANFNRKRRAKAA